MASHKQLTAIFVSMIALLQLFVMAVPGARRQLIESTTNDSINSGVTYKITTKTKEKKMRK